MTRSFIKFEQQQVQRYQMDTPHEGTVRRNDWHNVLGGHEYAPFPTLPPLVLESLPDSVIEHRFPQPQRSRSDITTSTLIYAAWALIAGRMVNSEDVMFGITVAGNIDSTASNNQTPESFIAIPMVVKAAKEQTISAYLQTVQQQQVQMASSERIGPAGQEKCSFQTLLVIQPLKDASPDEIDGQMQASCQKQWLSTQALTLELGLSQDNIAAKAIFDSRVILPWMMRNCLEGLALATQQLAVTDPEHRLAEVDFVTSQDLTEIWKWNSLVPRTVERCFHEIFEESVGRQPNALALSAWDGELTYVELDRLAAMVANKLIKLGGRPEIVPICFEKSMWTTVAMLGVLKAGGAFLLLDPSLPEKRLQFMARHVKAKIILSSLSTQSLSSRLVRESVTIDSMFFASLSEGSESDESIRHLPRQSPSSLMYVIFTSGSTGVPKCVKITHSNVSSALHHQVHLLGLTRNSRILDFASYSFTVAINNVCGALAVGGCLCVPNDQDRKERLSEVMRSFQANIIDLTPSVAQLLTPEEFPLLEILIVGGEALRAGLVLLQVFKHPTSLLVHIISSSGNKTRFSLEDRNPHSVQVFK